MKWKQRFCYARISVLSRREGQSNLLSRALRTDGALLGGGSGSGFCLLGAAVARYLGWDGVLCCLGETRLGLLLGGHSMGLLLGGHFLSLLLGGHFLGLLLGGGLHFT